MRACLALALILTAPAAGARDLSVCERYGALAQEIATEGERGVTYTEQMTRLRVRFKPTAMPTVKGLLDFLYGRSERYYPTAPPDAIGRFFRDKCREDMTGG